MTSNIENAKGFVIPNKITSASKVPCGDLNNSVVFQPKDISYPGTLLWYGKINDTFDAYGIETHSVEMGTNGTFNSNAIFSCNNGCGVIVKTPVKMLKINTKNEFIREVDICSYQFDEGTLSKQKNELIVVTYNENLRVGKYLGFGTINGIECYRIHFTGEENPNLIVSIDVLGNFTNENGVVNFYTGKYNITVSDFPYSVNINERTSFQYGNRNAHGTLKWKGLIDGFQCLAIDPDDGNMASDYRKLFDDSEANWTVICVENLNHIEISDPHDSNIYTYFKLKAYVRLLNETEGCVEKYAMDKKRNFYYGVKLDDEENLKYIPIDDLKCASPMEIGGKAFCKVDDPSLFGIETLLKLNDFIKVLPTETNELKQICFGEIVWWGFDKESSFKFLIKLEDPVDNGHSGTIYGEFLCSIRHGYGILVYPSCVVPLDTPHKKERTLKKQSQIVKEDVRQRYDINTGKDHGIQGDKNSCYLDTSFFAMFTFQEVFDHILYADKNGSGSSKTKELQECLRQYIIFPLRKYEFVSFDRVEYVRKKLGELFPEKMFVHSERDPEELLETLFHFLTPKDPFLNTFHLKNHVKQSCFLTQLFYVKVESLSSPVNINDMLDWTFLESDILMDKPPKCLILQLPRHGTKYKKFNEVNIKSKLDITHLIRYCEQKCIDCCKNAIYFCKECSESKGKFTYYCTEHKHNCKHEKFDIKYDIKNYDGENGSEKDGSEQNTMYQDKEEKSVFKGNVTMELFAILCIDKTHYVAYVKTGELSHKWVFFDSMATSDGDELHPLIRVAEISNYLLKGEEKPFNEDVERIKQFAFVCFYKNPTMEFYSKDFNHID